VITVPSAMAIRKNVVVLFECGIVSKFLSWVELGSRKGKKCRADMGSPRSSNGDAAVFVSVGIACRFSPNLHDSFAINSFDSPHQ